MGFEQVCACTRSAGLLNRTTAPRHRFDNERFRLGGQTRGIRTTDPIVRRRRRREGESKKKKKTKNDSPDAFPFAVFRLVKWSFVGNGSGTDCRTSQ